MGARWSWTAICEDGHLTSNFSGGPDNECDAERRDGTCCGSQIISSVEDEGMTRADVNALLWGDLAKLQRATREHLCHACGQPLPVPTSENTEVV